MESEEVSKDPNHSEVVNSEPDRERSHKKKSDKHRRKLQRAASEDDDRPANPDDIKLDLEESKVKEAQSDAESKKSRKGGKTTNFDSSHKGIVSQVSGLSGHGDSGFDIDDDDDDQDDENRPNKKEKTEEEVEQEKQLLLKMEWNKSFSPEYFEEEDKVDDALQSEKQAYERQVKREKKLGKDLWALIGYIAFFAIFSYLVFSHVRVSMLNMYNDALKNNIEGVTIFAGNDHYINVTEVNSYNEISNWLTQALPNIIDIKRNIRV